MKAYEPRTRSNPVSLEVCDIVLLALVLLAASNCGLVFGLQVPSR